MSCQAECTFLKEAVKLDVKYINYEVIEHIYLPNLKTHKGHGALMPPPTAEQKRDQYSLELPNRSRTQPNGGWLTAVVPQFAIECKGNGFG